MKVPTPLPQPKVFVSYSHDSAEHVDRVLALCVRLRQDGVDAEVDQYEPAPLEGWPHWMERQLQGADFVLLVCTESYRRRFEGKEESGRGLGATWEGAIVTQAIYEAAGANSKFIPVTLSAGDEAHIPGPLRRTTSYRLDIPNGYEDLYRRLTDQPAVAKPALGSIQPLPPRSRVTSFSPALDSLKRPIPLAPGKEVSTGEDSAPRHQRGAIIFSVSLATVLVMLTIILVRRNVPEPDEVRRRAVPLAPQLATVTSLSWSPNNPELLVVGARNLNDDNHLFRYSLDGKLVSEVANPPDGIRIERPVSAQTVGEEFVVKDEDVFVWLTNQYHPYKGHDLLTQSPNGDSFEAAFDWILAGGNLFALGDVKKGEKEDASSGDDLSREEWERGIVDVPLDAPSDFDMVRPIAENAHLSGLYLMGYPHLAKVGETAYFLEMKESPEIVRLRPEEWNRSMFQVRLNGFEGMPDFSGKRGQEAYRLFEGSAGIAGLYGWKDFLFVLSKCSTVPGMPTRWFMTGFDPVTKKQLYTVSLPAASPHVTVAPGRDYWAILERGPAQPGKNRKMCHRVYSLILVPTSEIETMRSPLRVDNSVPLCSRLATWSENPPGWSFEQ